MPHIGSMDVYDGVEPLDSYLQRVDAFFLANDIGLVKVPDGANDEARTAAKQTADRKKVASFLSSVGKRTFGVLQDLCRPGLPSECTYDELVQKLKTHYTPTKLEVAESFKFHRCVQSDSESVTEYSTRLRGAATFCNFAAFLKRALRDQFVCGVRSKDIQKKLLESDRDFQACIDVAVAAEAAAKESLVLSDSTPASVNVMGKQPKFNKDRYKSKQASNDSKTGSNYACYSCGGNHFRETCQFRNATCSKCKRKGHISTACKRKSVNLMDCESQSEQTSDCELFSVSSSGPSQILVPLLIEGHAMDFQLDTGCAVSLVPSSFYNKFCRNAPLFPTSTLLSTYTGEKVVPMGQCSVSVKYKDASYDLPLLVVDTGTVPLLGRNWLQSIKLDWPSLRVHYIRPLYDNARPVYPTSARDVDSLIQQHAQLFQARLGCYNGPPVELKVEETPQFHKPRQVPYALLPKVEATLKQMEEDGILERVPSAPCAAPIVSVMKRDHSLRVCGDFSVTFNRCAKLREYPIPRIEDLHVALRGCTIFSVLDMSQAYHQIPVATESRKWLTVNTHMGLFSYKRIPNGIHSGPAVFQEIMDSVLAGIPKVICYLDDILVAGVDKQDHLATLSVVFERLEGAGFTLNKSKCTFERSSVTYLAHRIDADGLHPTEAKLKAIQDAPVPTDVTQLKSFLGLLMFYSRFLPFHSIVLAPLNRLLQKDIKWKWESEEEKAFRDAKDLLLNSQTLVHYDTSLPLYLSCDASSYGAGAVLSHLIDGQFRPIAFASCSLTKTQKNYSQLDKEALSIIFGLKRFHQFLYGRHFTILTDHKPLLTLLGPDKPVPVHCAARLQRWSLILAAYDYELEYRNTTAHSDADLMSRLPLPQTWEPTSENTEAYFFDVTAIDGEEVAKETAKDPVLSRVMRYVQHGWPSGSTDARLQPYKSRKDELSVDQGCVLWGIRVIIPESLQKSVLQELHETHQGIVKMKCFARSYVWWPGLDGQIEKLVATCDVCQEMRPDPPRSQLHPWSYPTVPWSRVHIDFAGNPGAMYLVIVDAYSKYPEVIKMSSTTSVNTVRVLRDVFSRHGLPEVLVSDNGPQLVSAEFEEFCVKNGIMHRTSAVNKPSANGQAERVVQILKSALRQARTTGEDVDTVVARFLLVYRATPHSATGQSPSVLLMGCQIRTRLDLIRPSVRPRVEKYEQKMTAGSTCRSFAIGDTVRAKNFGVDCASSKWKNGIIREVLSSKDYNILMENGQVWKRHVDQIIHRAVDANARVPVQAPDTKVPVVPPASPRASVVDRSAEVDLSVPVPEPAESAVPELVPPEPAAQSSDVDDAQTTPVSDVSQQTPQKRYPDRERKPPVKLKDYEY